MSSKDKTGDKLIASMRKSKTGTVASKTSERPDARETAAQSSAATSRPATKTTTSDTAENGYSSGRRVWPD